MFDRAINLFAYLIRHLGYLFRREAKTTREFVEMVRFNKCSTVEVGAYVLQRVRVQRNRYPYFSPPATQFDYGLRLTGRTPGGRTTIMYNELCLSHFGQGQTNDLNVALMAEQRIRELQPLLPGVSLRISSFQDHKRQQRS